MPNYCNYEMKVKGKKESIEELIDVMLNYDRDKHFMRVFGANVWNEEDLGNGQFAYNISGDCAWSVYSCMCKCGKENPLPWDLTYCDNAKEKGTSLKEESERLQLEIEVYSDEPGVGFQEHYHYKNGETIADECLDCVHYWWNEYEYPTFEEYKKENDVPEEITEDMFSEDNECIVGGFGNWEFSF